MRNELFIGGYAADLIENLDINITKEIYDIQDPAKTKSDYTKTVSISGSKNNDFIFRSLFDVNFDITNTTQLEPYFNPAKKANCVYYQDTLVQIEGYCQLKEIVILKENKVTYNIVISGKKRDLFSKIANLTLQDIQGLGTATYNDTEIQQQWGSPTLGSDKLVYPLINKNQDYTEQSVNWARIYDFKCFKPFSYVKFLFDNIIKEAGFEYESNFLATPQFRKLILQCDIRKFVLNQSVIDSYYVDANTSSVRTLTAIPSNQTNNIANYWSKQFIFNNEVSDPANQFDPVTSTFTMANSGYTTIKTDIKIRINDSLNRTGFDLHLILKRGTSYIFLATAPIRFTAFTTPQDFVYSFNYANQLLQAGDEVRMVLGNFYIGGNMANNGSPTISYANNGSNRFEQIVNGQILYNNVFNVNDIQYPMQQKDFIMGLVKMFNLYIETDYTGKLIIEPRDDFFTSEVKDWTNKLDVSKDFKIQPQGLLETKSVQFNYTKNEDYYSQSFFQDTGNISGFKNIEFDNDFVKDVKKVDVPFCLPPMRNKNFGVGMHLTRYKDEENVESSVKPIIAYYNGLINGDVWYYGSQTLGNVQFTQYPYAGHLDTIVNPTYDLCFAQQPIYYYPAQLPTFNLYNQFHRKQWLEIGDRNSKLVECYIKLNSFDISTLSFRPLYFIKNAYYRLLEIEDYQPNGKETTKCKFLKVISATDISNTTTTTNGDNGNGNGNNGNDWHNGNVDSGGGTIRGNNNWGLVTLGQNIQIGDNARQSIVIGDNNIVNGGVKGAFVVNSNGNIISTDNTTLIAYNFLNIEDNYTILGNEGSPLYLFCDNDLAGGNITIDLPDDALNVGKYYIINKIKSTHQVIIKAHDGTTLDTLTSIDTLEYLIT